MRFSGFAELLARQAAARGDAPALIFEENGARQTLGYAALWRRVRARADELRAEGKSCLAVLADGSAACVVEIFAAVAAGLQVAMLDGRAPVPMLAALLRYTDADALWGEAELCAALTPHLTAGVADGRGRLLFFTSGTTERAKAAVLTDASLCASAWNGAAKLPLGEDDILLCLLPLGHVFGFVCGLLWGLVCGAAVALGRGARHYGDDCAFFAPTALSAVPLLLGFLVKQNLLDPALELVLVGAGDCPLTLLDAVRARGIRVSFGYGLTETSSGVAISVSGDPYAMEVCPDDAITLAEDGEILVSAPTCMMQGYYKRPEETAAALAGGVLHTGDLGFFDANGRLHISGRKKDILVLGDGTKIFLPEYEGRLAALLGTAELAVILLGGRPALVYGGAESEAMLWAKLRPMMAQLPRGHQLTCILAAPGPLPRTATGKIKRWEIQRKAEEL